MSKIKNVIYVTKSSWVFRSKANILFNVDILGLGYVNINTISCHH